MANNQRYISLCLVLFSCLSCCSYAYNQLVVGGRDGWVLHPSESYNNWAGRLRFQVKDSLLFKYNSAVDSVLVVNKGDYDSCHAANPLQSFTDGNTVFTFDRSGPFYFITGNKTNCDGGQKMIIVVIATRTPPAAATPPSSAATPPTGAVPSPSPTTGVPSPAGGAPSPASSPSSPSPAGGAPSPASSPSSPSPSGGAPSPLSTPVSPSPVSNGPSGSSTSPGSPTASAPGSDSSSSGSTPADGGAPPPPRRSFASPSRGPSGLLMLAVTVVLSVALGGFIG